MDLFMVRKFEQRWKITTRGSCKKKYIGCRWRTWEIANDFGGYVPINDIRYFRYSVLSKHLLDKRIMISVNGSEIGYQY